METLVLEKGVIETGTQPVADKEPVLTLGAVGLKLAEVGNSQFAVAERNHSAHDKQPHSEQAQKPRYGYRQDSPPEVVGLLEQAQAGDTDAYAELYRLHVNRVTAYIRARMKYEDQQAVPDVVQATFCEAFAGLGTGHHDVTGWFLSYAAKAYIDYVRSVRKQERAERATKEFVRREYAHGYARQHPGDITAIGHVMLVHAIARLTPGQREVVQHRYIDGQTQLTTAIATGRTLKAVKSAEHRAVVKMREGLAPAKATTE